MATSVAKLSSKECSILENNVKYKKFTTLQKFKHIYIGDEIERWNAMKLDNACKSDIEVARLLLDIYQIYKTSYPIRFKEMRELHEIKTDDLQSVNGEDKSLTYFENIQIKEEPESDFDSNQIFNFLKPQGLEMKEETLNCIHPEEIINTFSKSCLSSTEESDDVMGASLTSSDKKCCIFGECNSHSSCYSNSNDDVGTENMDPVNSGTVNNENCIAYNQSFVEEKKDLQVSSQPGTKSNERLVINRQNKLSADRCNECQSFTNSSHENDAKKTTVKMKKRKYTRNGRRKKRKRGIRKKDFNESNKESVDSLVSNNEQNTCISDQKRGCTTVSSGSNQAGNHELGDDEFLCADCGERFLSAEELDLHATNRHKTVPVQRASNSCHSTARCKEWMTEHVRLKHSGVTGSISDSDTATHGRHTRSRINYSRGLCDICGAEKKYLREHMYYVHNAYDFGQGRVVICEGCGAEFPNRVQLNKHRLTRHTEKTIHCKFNGCKVMFKTNGLMERHYKLVHLGIKRFVCPYEGCLFRTGDRTSFGNHTRAIHLKIRSFPCTWSGCNKSFFDNKNLVVHERIHADVKPVRCEFCDYRCRQRTALNWHLRTKHKEQASMLVGVSSSVSGVPKNVPVGVPALSHALKSGRKKKQKANT